MWMWVCAARPRRRVHSTCQSDMQKQVRMLTYNASDMQLLHSLLQFTEQEIKLDDGLALLLYTCRAVTTVQLMIDT